MENEDYGSAITRNLEQLCSVYERIRRESRKLEPDPRFNLELGELRLLRWLNETRFLELWDVRERTGWNESQTSEKLARLEDWQLLRRWLNGADRRKHVLSTGRKTKETIEKIEELYGRAFAQAFPGLAKRQRDLFLAMNPLMGVINRKKLAVTPDPELGELEEL